MPIDVWGRGAGALEGPTVWENEEFAFVLGCVDRADTDDDKEFVRPCLAPPLGILDVAFSVAGSATISTTPKKTVQSRTCDRCWFDVRGSEPGRLEPRSRVCLGRVHLRETGLWDS